jgi:hypothetical protein
MTVRIILLALCGWLLAQLARDSALFASAELRAVRIVQFSGAVPGPIAKSGNAGIFLGKIWILTAAHVAQRHTPGDTLHIEVAGRLIDARLVKAGSFDKTDVSLLEVSPDDVPQPMRSLPLLAPCRHPVLPGTRILVVEPGNISYSSVIAADILPPDVPRRFDSLIRDVDTTGNSGSALFDLDRGCLAGIMSARIDLLGPDGPGGRVKQPVAKYFVPAAKISIFLKEAGDGF